MKRIVLLIMIMLCVMVCFGCGKKDASRNMITGKDEYVAEYFQKAGKSVSESKEKIKLIEFMEKEYEAEYSESGTSYTLPYTFDYYKAGKNTFELSADTDEVIQFRSELYFDEDKRNATLPILSEDELKDKADSYAKKFIDIEEYQVSVENKTDYKAYKYTYTRYIDGYETSDRFAVALSDRGEIIFYSNSLMRNIKYVSLEGFDKEKAYEAVKEVLKEQYPDADPDTFEPDREILTLTEDNEVAFYYLATVVIFYGSGGEEIREAVPVRLIW